jgi:threonine/homoserine/homoserine lactone efflux protein
MALEKHSPSYPVRLGFTLLLIFVSFGLYTVIASHPSFFKYLNVLGSIFILYQGYKIATSQPDWSLKKGNAPDLFREC